MQVNVISALLGFGMLVLGLGACAGTSSESESGQSAAEAKVSTGICAGGRFKCHARRASKTANHDLEDGPVGLGADDLANAYEIDTSVDPKATIALVDAFGYQNAESDLATYRQQYGLPPCTVSNGCLTIVNQEGQTSPLPDEPPSDDDWTVETALDLQMASAGCPKCKLLLIQTDNDQDEGLFIVQALAAKLGATVISNSWGDPEDSDNVATDSEHYFQGLDGIAIFVAAGDTGFDDGGDGPDYPSTSAFVTAVGGTTLTQDTSSSRGWTETAWSGDATTGAGGSSCSLTIPQPTYQKNLPTGCNRRATTDVSAVGDPNNGPAVFNNGQWQQLGGTSAAAPLVAAIFALTGNGGAKPSFAYTNASSFHDVKSGNNGTCAGALCNAGVGWDGPTGNGTPNGTKLAALTSKSAPTTSQTSGCGHECNKISDKL